MNIIKVKDYAEMSQLAAAHVIGKVRKNPQLKLGLATGSTPEGLYKIMVEDCKKNGTTYRDVTTFNLDEYIGLSPDDPQSYRYFMDHHLLDHIDIQKVNTHLPRGDAEDEYEEAEAYEELIVNSGGIDVQILGIGRNGHIGFNEPGTSFDAATHVVQLSDSTREANAKFFGSLDLVPERAISMGISTIMRSGEILLVVSGEEKSEALERLISGTVDESFPASILKTHGKVTIIADEAALESVKHLV